MKITAKKSIQVIKAGNHIVTIDSYREDVSKNTGSVQAVYGLKTEDGAVLTYYANTRGLVKNEDGSYKKDRKGNYVEDPIKTQKCMDILGKLAFHAGVAEGEDIELEDLEGCTVGIHVEMEEATIGDRAGEFFPRVKWSFDPELIDNQPEPESVNA